MKNIKTLQVAFNLADPYQKGLYEYVTGCTTNTSYYLKRLIQQDQEGKAALPVQEVAEENDDIDLIKMMI